MLTDVFGFIASCFHLIILRKKQEYVRWIFLIIQSPQTPKSDIVDDSEEETAQVSLAVINLPPFPCLCNAHEFINKVASL